MGFEVTKKNVKDVSSFPSQSELKGKKKRGRKKEKSQSQRNLLASSWDLLRTEFIPDTEITFLKHHFRSALHIYITAVLAQSQGFLCGSPFCGF